MSKKLDTIKLELGIDPQIILEKIDYIAKNCNTTYSDAILHYCKTSNTEIEVVEGGLGGFDAGVLERGDDGDLDCH